MLKLTWKQLNNPGFAQAMVKLNQSTQLDAKTAYRVGRICQAAIKEMEKSELCGKKLKEKWPKKEDAEALKKAMEEAMEENFVEIKVHKLDFNLIRGLTGGEMIAIEHIMDNVPDIA